MGCHPKPIDEHHDFSRWAHCTSNQKVLMGNHITYGIFWCHVCATAMNHGFFFGYESRMWPEPQNSYCGVKLFKSITW